MIKYLFIGFFCLLTAVHSIYAQVMPEVPGAGEISETVQVTVERAIDMVKPALVRIHVVTVYDEQGQVSKYEAAGSGVIITKTGHVITNHHVAGRAIRIVCTLANKEEIEAELIGTDPLSDICVIKLNNENNVEYPYVTFGDSDKLKVGESVLAMGSPLALSQSVTMGIVSNTEMVMPDVFRPFKLTMEGEDVGSLVRWIGHDAAIYPGNSGGPLVNLEGEIIGINEIRYGIAGAIPADLARKVADQLIKNGKVVRAWIGIEPQPLLKSGKSKKGVLVGSVIDGSPAFQSGIRPGDIILSVAGREFDIHFAEEIPIFNQFIVECAINEPVEMKFLRDNKIKSTKVTPVEREYLFPRSVELKKWGLTVRDISLIAAKEMKRPDQNGVYVTSVRPGGPGGSCTPNISPGDIIVNVENNKIKNTADLINITEQLTAKQKDTIKVTLVFDRRQSRYLTVVNLAKSSIEEQGQELQKAWLGIATQVLTREIASKLGLEGMKGVRVIDIFEESAAEKAGVKIGDIITAIDDIKINASDPSDVEILAALIREYKIGAEIEISIIRDGKEKTLKARLMTSPKMAREMKKYRDENFEITVRDIAFTDRIDEKWSLDQEGVIVESITDGSWSALANITIGDLLLDVDHETIKNVDDFKKVMENVANKKSSAVVFKVLRGIYTVFIEVEPDWVALKDKEK